VHPAQRADSVTVVARVLPDDPKPLVPSIPLGAGGLPAQPPSSPHKRPAAAAQIALPNRAYFLGVPSLSSTPVYLPRARRLAAIGNRGRSESVGVVELQNSGRDQVRVSKQAKLQCAGTGCLSPEWRPIGCGRGARGCLRARQCHVGSIASSRGAATVLERSASVADGRRAPLVSMRGRHPRRCRSPLRYAHTTVPRLEDHRIEVVDVAALRILKSASYPALALIKLSPL
jgi:hypothetical protein